MSEDRTRNARQRRHKDLKRRNARIVPVPIDFEILDLLEGEGYLVTTGCPDWNNINRVDVTHALVQYLKNQAG